MIGHALSPVPVAGPGRALGMGERGSDDQFHCSRWSAAVVVTPRHFVGVGLRCCRRSGGGCQSRRGAAGRNSSPLGSCKRHPQPRTRPNVDPLHRVAGMQDVPCAARRRELRCRATFWRIIGTASASLSTTHVSRVPPVRGQQRRLGARYLASDDRWFSLPVRRLRTLANMRRRFRPRRPARRRPIVAPIASRNLCSSTKAALGLMFMSAPSVAPRAFDAVAEQRDYGEVVADRQLAAMEDRPGGDGELAAAAGAFPAHGVSASV